MNRYFLILASSQLYGFISIKNYLKKENKGEKYSSEQLNRMVECVGGFSQKSSKIKKVMMMKAIFSEIKLRIALCSTLLEENKKI